MKILRKIVYISSLLVIICLTKNVSAATYYDGTTSHLNIGGCNPTYKYCWANIGSSFELQGIRVTAYNKEGQRVSKSVDFTNNRSIISTINNSIYYMAASRENKSRVEYIDSPLIVRTTGAPDIQYANFVSFIQTKVSGHTDLETIIAAVQPDIESKLDICTGSYKKLCKESTYYLVVEPLTIIWSRTEQHDYYGTYYELSYLIENSQYLGSYPFKKGNGVSPFLPGNIALSLYISTDNEKSAFNSFYKAIGLERVGTKELENVKYYINNYYHDELKKLTVGSDNVGKGYGIGVVLAKYSSSIPTPKDEDDVHVNLCNDHDEPDKSGVIWVQYEDRTLVDDRDGEYSVKWNNKIVCQVVCDEKYYIEAWSLDNNLNPINDEGILAGSYVAINSPTVYHKKTCEYQWVMDKSSLRTAIFMKYLPPGMTIKDEDEFQRKYDLAIDEYEKKIDECSNLETKFQRLVSNVKTDAENDAVGDLKLTLFSTYTLTAEKTATQISQNYVGTINGESYQYGYHNTFVYSIAGDVNKYIDMTNVVDDNTNVASTTNIGDGITKATTSITIKEGYYDYKIDYLNVFASNSNFSNIIAKESLTTKLDASCPYKIVERNITNKCAPTARNNYCGGEPDINFSTPKINMQYRPIDLNNPFPGKLGTTRTPGANWQPIKELENGVEVTVVDYVDTYITLNRKLYDGQSPEEIYIDREPIYTISLNPSNISAIREYNETHSYDDFELSCREGNGTECISSFLRDENYIDLGGTCSDVTTVDRSQFYSCADK